MEWVVLLGLIFVWRSHASRINKLERERAFQENVIRELTRRVYALERGPVVEPLAAPEPASEPAPEPAPQLSIPIEPAIETATEPLPEPVAPGGLLPAQDFRPRPVPWEGVVGKLRGQDWEAIVGGSWLNAAGVLLVVVGISLLLGYGVTQFG
ncbi:MAG: hypothetical protein SFV51_03995, partial [Bryobacteraceae bacterium]|nr:hypothetical protein [Bryobacteraceae bacterium]